MTREGWVHPPLVAVEPLPRQALTWRRRLASAALAVALLGVLAAARETLGTPAQDPGVAPPPAAGAGRGPTGP